MKTLIIYKGAHRTTYSLNGKRISKKQADLTVFSAKKVTHGGSGWYDLAAEKLAADKKHRKQINNKAISVIFDILEKYQDSKNWQAEGIVEAIAKGEVPHVQIKY